MQGCGEQLAPAAGPYWCSTELTRWAASLAFLLTGSLAGSCLVTSFSCASTSDSTVRTCAAMSGLEGCRQGVSSCSHSSLVSAGPKEGGGQFDSG